jgi:hypothetical protein
VAASHNWHRRSAPARIAAPGLLPPPDMFLTTILGYRIFDEDDELKGRIIFRFEYSLSRKGVSAGDGGWSYEKKII